MKELSLIIHSLSEEDAGKLKALLLNKGYTNLVFSDELPELVIPWLYQMKEPRSIYKRTGSSEIILNDPEFWNQIPEPAKTKLIQYLSELWIQYQVPVVYNEQIAMMFNQNPPPPPGFMKGIIMSEDFDHPLEDFKEYM